MVNLLSSHSGPCDRHGTICVSHQVMLFDRLECPSNKLAVGAEIRLGRETQAFYLRTARWEMRQIKEFFDVQVCYYLTKLGMLDSDVGVFVNLIYVLCNRFAPNACFALDADHKTQELVEAHSKCGQIWICNELRGGTK